MNDEYQQLCIAECQVYAAMAGISTVIRPFEDEMHGARTALGPGEWTADGLFE